MIRLDKLFNLNHEVYRAIPREQLRVPLRFRSDVEQQYETEEYMDARTARLCVVGQECEGVVLIARDGYHNEEKKTFIDLYDLNQKKLDALYMHEAPMNCVGASISENRCLLAFTTLTKFKKSSSQSNDGEKRKQREVMFQSYIVENYDAGRRFKLNIRYHTVQRVQFIYGLLKAKHTYLLFFLDREFVHLYQIACRQTTGGGVRITQQPNLESIVARRHAFLQYDIETRLLYIIVGTSRNRKSDSADVVRTLERMGGTPSLSSSGGSLSGSSGSDSHRSFGESEEYVLRCYSFPGKQGKLRFSIPLRISLKQYMRLSTGSPSSAAAAAKAALLQNSTPSIIGAYNGLHHRAISPARQYITIVQLSGNACCLCQQHLELYTVGSIPSIKVTIFLLHHKSRLEFFIRLTDIDPMSLYKLRVYFARAGDDLLMIYVPSYHFQLVDCGSSHHPALSLCLTGPEFATILPSQWIAPAHDTPVGGGGGGGGGYGAIPVSSSLISRPAASSASRSPGEHHDSTSRPAHTALSSSSTAAAASNSDPALAASTAISEPAALLTFDCCQHLPGNFLLDTVSGIAYEFDINRAALLRLFDMDPTDRFVEEIHVSALHLAMLHLNDSELADQIITNLCEKPRFITRPLLREYLIASTYSAMKQENIDPTLLALLPMTSMEHIRRACQLNRSLNATYSALSGYFVYPSGDELVVRDRECMAAPARFDLLALEGERGGGAAPAHQAHSHPSLPAIQRSGSQGSVSHTPEPQASDSPIKSFISRMFGIESESTPVAPPSIDEFESAYTFHYNLAPALAAHLGSVTQQRLKAQANIVATMYFSKAVLQINKFYKTLRRSNHHVLDSGSLPDEEAVLFQLLENLFGAIEELSFPAPRNFASDFLSLGLRCLPQPVFLLYVERGILVLNDKFVLNAVSSDDHDHCFLHHILCRLQDQQQILAIMRHQPHYVQVLLDRFLASVRVPTPSERQLNIPPNLESTELSSFMPKTVLLQRLSTLASGATAADEQVALSFVEEHKAEMLRSIGNIHRSPPL